MDKRAEYLIQVLGQIGSPLMSAIVAASENSEPEQDAQKMAELLGKTVELSISMSSIADLSSVENDSVRVAMTGLASPLIGKLYEHGKQTPSENDLKRISSALQAVLTFSENFTPDEENTERLKNLANNGAGGDAHQITVQYLEAFIPAVNAIATFPFGQPEQKLVMDVSSRVTEQARNMRSSLLGELPEAQKQAVDLALLKTLVTLYGACHQEETKRLIDSNDEDEGGLENVWKNFDTRAAMIEALARSLIPGSAASDGQEIEPATEPEAPVEQPAPAEVTPTDPEPEPETKGTAPASSPMSMFAKPKNNDEAESAPSEEPKTEEKTSSDEASDESSGGSPMSFFKKPD